MFGNEAFVSATPESSICVDHQLGRAHCPKAMKNFRMTAALLVGVLLALILDSFRVSHTNANQSRELAALRLALEQAQEGQKNAAAQRDHWQAEADRLRQWSEEVHQLRAEVSRLNREISQTQTARDIATRNTRKAETAPGQLQEKSKTQDSTIPIAIESAPSPVQVALLREFGSPLPKGVLVSFVDKEGRTTYPFKGQSADGKPVYVRMGEDGSVIEKSVDIPTESVPAHIQTPVAQILGNASISGAREIRAGADVRYELTAKGPEAGMRVAVRGDGTLISYSAVFQPTEKEQRDQSVKGQRTQK